MQHSTPIQPSSGGEDSEDTKGSVAAPSSLLFVCLGNICRSPAAEAVLRQVLEESGSATGVRIDSAGTAGYHEGEPADARMIRSARNRGFAVTSRARQVRKEDFHRFDLIVAMDNANYRDLQHLAPPDAQARVVRFIEFLHDPGPFAGGVPDPYYGGSDGFEVVLDILEEGCRTIASQIQRPPHE